MTAILIVDDDPGAVGALVTLLELDGYHAVGLTDPEEALAQLERRRFDVVITDLEMPGIHGVDVARAARLANPEAAILVVTAYDRSAASARALAVGAQRVFGKPLHYEELRAEVERRLRPSLVPAPIDEEAD